MKLLLIASALFLFNLTQIYSQLKDSCCQNYSVNSYLKLEDFTAGITAGYSIKSKVPSYGINFDYMLYQVKAGLISIGTAGNFSSAAEENISSGFELKTRNITAGITGKIFFNRLGFSSIIPFAGVMLGYNNAVTEYYGNNATGYFPNTLKHSFYITGKTGLYFFVSNNLLLNINFSTGNIDKGILEGGISFKF